jgi:hypothetical protein
MRRVSGVRGTQWPDRVGSFSSADGPADAPPASDVGFPGDGWDTEQSFNLTLYMMAPHFFGAQAYRHFMRLEDRQAFLLKVLSGSALMDEQPP